MAENIADEEIPACDKLGNKVSEVTDAELIQWVDTTDDEQIIKELLVERLKSRGFPVAYLRAEADSSFGVYVENETTIIPLDYAIGMLEEDKIKHISDLAISILAELVDHGIYKTDRDWEYMEQEKEDAIKATEAMNMVQEEGKKRAKELKKSAEENKEEG